MREQMVDVGRHTLRLVLLLLVCSARALTASGCAVRRESQR